MTSAAGISSWPWLTDSSGLRIVLNKRPGPISSLKTYVEDAPSNLSDPAGQHLFCAVNVAQPAVQRIAYYRDLAAQFRGWAEDETNQEARDRLLEMARQYERLASGSRALKRALLIVANPAFRPSACDRAGSARRSVSVPGTV